VLAKKSGLVSEAIPTLVTPLRIADRPLLPATKRNTHLDLGQRRLPEPRRPHQVCHSTRLVLLVMLGMAVVVPPVADAIDQWLK
jgi:hypothetical protein